MTIKDLGTFVSGTFYTDRLLPDQMDVYSVQLTAGQPYSFRDVASDSPLIVSLSGAAGSSQGISASLQSGDLLNYTAPVSGNYWLMVHSLDPDDQYTLSGGDRQVDYTNMTTGQSSTPFMMPYDGPVIGLQEQFVAITPDNLNIAAATPNVFLHSGSGMDGLTAYSGDNVLDGGSGSNFLIGGIGNDTFYMDDRNPDSPVLSTIVNFHQGDAATVWGVNASGFKMITMDDQGAAGAKGVDLLFSKPGQPDVSFILAGYTKDDLTSGKLNLAYGHTADWNGYPGSDYLTVTVKAG
jgi:Ca2+-binding RTX toxin-like protein